MVAELIRARVVPWWRRERVRAIGCFLGGVAVRIACQFIAIGFWRDICLFAASLLD